MNMFDPLRPTLPSGTKALLTEGSAIPHVNITFVPPRLLRLSVLLRNFTCAERAYSYRHTDLPPHLLEAFFSDYILDPEAALLRYFGWEPQADSRAQTPQVASVFADADDLL